METPQIIEKIRSWLSSMVIGLNLCPFAEKVFKGDTIRYSVCQSTEAKDLLEVLADELQRLRTTPRSECETTLLIAPHVLPDFLDFNDFLGIAEQLVDDLKLTGEIQVVGFHPDFMFAESDKNAPENYTNRSPFPMLHLLREISISEVAEVAGDLMEIPRRNTRTLQELGTVKILERLKNL